MGTYWWIRAIDWRISSGVIFTFILILWGWDKRRQGFGQRALISCLALCAGSFLMRFIIEELFVKPFAIAIGFSLYLLALSLMYLACYWFCCRVSLSEYLFKTTVALTVYRIAWNVNKVITTGMVQLPLSWPAAPERATPLQSLSSYIIYFAVCFFCHRLYWRIVNHKHPLSLRNSLLLLNIVLWFQVILELSYRLVNPDDGSTDMLLFFFTSLMYCLMSYALLLTVRFVDALRQDKAQMESFIASKQKYYEISREGILSLQTKTHDLKHQIMLIRSAEGKQEFDKCVDRLAESIDEYNTVIETGNKSVDIVLTEKNIICHSKGIKFTYMVDGTLFNLLSEMEVYSLFGNIMDNAIESIMPKEDCQNDYILMKAARRGGMLILYVENSFDRQLVYEQGKLVTSKENKHLHGYGLRSIQDIANKYSGIVSIKIENQVFKLTVTMQAPTT